MKNIIFALCMFPVIISGLEFSAEALGGYRQDELTFEAKIFEDDAISTDNVKFDSIRVWEVGGRATLSHCGFLGFFEGKYGWVDSGDFSLSTESEDPTAIRSHPLNGETYNLTGAGGYRFSFCDCKLGVTPLVGYSYYHNDYRTSGGTFTPIPEDSDLTVLDIHYCNHFSGPWVGVQAHYFITDCFRVFGEFRYLWLNFGGNVHAHITFDFPEEDSVFENIQEFTQKIDTHGPLFKVGADWYFTPCLYVGALFEYRYFCGRNGKEDSRGMGIFSQNGVVIDREVTTSADELTKLKMQTYLVEVHIGFDF